MTPASHHHHETPTGQTELAVLRAAGTPNQLERWNAGLLPEEELLSLARNLLYAPFRFPRWSVNRDRERMAKLAKQTLRTRSSVEFLRHGPACTGTTITDAHLSFASCAADALTADEWTLYKLYDVARAAVEATTGPGSVRVEPTKHWVTCGRCGGAAYKISVKVSIDWAGRTLVREYALDPSREAHA